MTPAPRKGLLVSVVLATIVFTLSERSWRGDIYSVSSNWTPNEVLCFYKCLAMNSHEQAPIIYSLNS